MSIEFELKFRATPERIDEIRQNTPGAETRFAMQTTYYDTPNSAFSRQHCTLRRRMENNSSVCTLKTPAQGQGRQEYELNCPEITDAIPELCKLAGREDLLLAAMDGVVPVCGARFTRIAKTVTLGDTVAELALDQGVLTGGGREQDLCEVEVELKSGTRDAVYAYAMQLALAYGLTPEKESKFRRAQKLAKENDHGRV